MAAFEYACQGVTSMEEVMRLGGQIDEFDEVADMMGGLAPVEERAYATV